MNEENMRNRLIEIIKEKLEYCIEDNDQNLFDVFPAYDLLYIIEPIESEFNISIARVVHESDHNLITINGLVHKIQELKNAVGDY